MTPWGDLTNALQRLQLVAFIRTLSKEQEERQALGQTLYQTFDTELMVIDEARIQGNKEIKILEDQKKMLLSNQKNLEKENEVFGRDGSEAVQVYKNILETDQKIFALKEQDQRFVNLKNLIKQEKELYFNVAVNLLSKNIEEPVFKNYLNLIRLNVGRYTLDNHILTNHHNSEVDEKIRKSRKEIVDELDKKIKKLLHERQIIEGKIASSLQREELMANQEQINGYNKIKAKLETDIDEAIRLANKQQEKN